MRKPRKRYTPDEKVSLLRRHLIDRTPVSELCEELHLQPTVFYRWLKQFFEHGSAAFEKRSGASQVRQTERKIEALQAKLRKKDEVLGELMEEHVALKKSLGGL